MEELFNKSDDDAVERSHRLIEVEIVIVVSVDAI